MDTRLLPAAPLRVTKYRDCKRQGRRECSDANTVFQPLHTVIDGFCFPVRSARLSMSRLAVSAFPYRVPAAFPSFPCIFCTLLPRVLRSLSAPADGRECLGGNGLQN